MKYGICNEIEELINLNYSDIFYVVNYDYYIWLYSISNNKLSAVIHGGQDKPYEIILISAENDKNVSLEFSNKNKMFSYLKNKLIDEMMMYEI